MLRCINPFKFQDPLLSLQTYHFIKANQNIEKNELIERKCNHLFQEKFIQDTDSIFRGGYRMPFNVRMGVNFIIIAPFESLIAKEVDFLEILIFYVSKTVSLRSKTFYLVPAGWEYIKGNLTTDRVS